MKTRRQLLGMLALFASLATISSAGDDAKDFAGTWTRNDRYSQSALGKVELALGEAGTEGVGGKAFNAFSTSSLLKQVDRVALRDALFDFARRLRRLTIEQEANELHVTVGDDYLTLLYLDGQEHVRQLRDGLTLLVTARRDGDSISVEQKGEEGDSIKELYSLLSDGRQLALLFQLESNLIDESVVFRLVYDRDHGEP